MCKISFIFVCVRLVCNIANSCRYMLQATCWVCFSVTVSYTNPLVRPTGNISRFSPFPSPGGMSKSCRKCVCSKELEEIVANAVLSTRTNLRLNNACSSPRPASMFCGFKLLIAFVDACVCFFCVMQDTHRAVHIRHCCDKSDGYW